MHVSHYNSHLVGLNFLAVCFAISPNFLLCYDCRMYSSSRMKVGVPLISFQISAFLSVIWISASKFFILVSMIVHVKILYVFY